MSVVIGVGCGGGGGGIGRGGGEEKAVVHTSRAGGERWRRMGWTPKHDAGN